jgi:DNA-binding NtrC family response regulator
MLEERRKMPGQKANLHLVDDDGDLRLVLSILLTQEGCRVRSTEDGFSAFCEIWSKVPDILSSDINMPGMSSFEFLSVVNRRFPAISEIAMSGAFASDTIPLGVATDVFYVKGSDRSLHLVETMTRDDANSCTREAGCA